MNSAPLLYDERLRGTFQAACSSSLGGRRRHTCGQPSALYRCACSCQSHGGVARHAASARRFLPSLHASTTPTSMGSACAIFLVPALPLKSATSQCSRAESLATKAWQRKPGRRGAGKVVANKFGVDFPRKVAQAVPLATPEALLLISSFCFLSCAARFS